MTNYLDPEIETMAKKKLDSLQAGLLRETCSYAWENSRFYRDLWSEQYPGDLEDLPFLTKQHLVDVFPFDLCTMPKDELVSMSLTSGSSGRPTIALKSREDLETATHFDARKLVMFGLSKTDILQITMAYGLWAAGLAIHLAAEKLGCLVVPSGPGNTKRQIWLLQNLGTTVLCAVPDYYLRIIEVGEQMGVDFDELPLRIAISGAGVLKLQERARIERLLGVAVRNFYGMSEVGGIAGECEANQGLHVWNDEFFLEVIDPETGEVLGEGERGELVITSLKRRATPIIRYRTGDLVSVLSTEPCECGRTHLRISGEIERLDDLVKIRGVLVSPKAIERHIGRYPELTGNFLIQARQMGRPGLLCELRPSIESEFLMDTVESVVEELKNSIGLTFDVAVVPYGELPVELEGKRVQNMPPST